ncbi:MAG: acyl-CoA thioesterase [Bacteroidetes bacterium]|nr:acyl-CoA thioesterase [Bacteroidales bacterium]MBU1009505.1 acyl-CoA thioesterase [Bacteroidota bacterium]
MSDVFHIELKVRDYECDMQGVVNNANYQHYLEHARHEYLPLLGLDFARLTAEGVILVVKRIELDYHFPLRSGDSFTVSCRPERISPLRFGFHQQIHRLADNKLIVDARVVATAINRQGRPFLPPEIDKAFA